MKITFLQPKACWQWLAAAPLAAGIFTFSGTLSAQTPVTGVFTHWTNASTGASYSATGATGNVSSGLSGNTYNYQFGTTVSVTNNVELLDSFIANSLNFYFLPVTPIVKFRRVDNASVTGLRKSLWIEYSGGGVSGPGGTASLLPAYDDSLERIFSGHIFNIGIDNNFQNAVTTNNSNIERVDVIFPSGISATTDLTKLGFVVFDRGSAGGHDPFQIAAIKTLDAAGYPSAYFTATTVSAANYGNIGKSLNYHILRRNPTDAKLEVMTPNNNQNRDGVFLTFSALNIPSLSTIVYGYSIFSPDVTTSPVSKMVNYNIAAFYPNTTDLSGGGLDQVAVTGVAVTNASFILLPESITAFNASPGDGKVQISWQLGTIDNLASTVIERSGDRINFSPLLSFVLPGTGPQTASDYHPLAGENYYRLKLVNSDGSIASYSSVCRVNMPDAGTVSLNIYPNPVTNKHFTIDARGLQNESYHLCLFDMSGKLVFGQTLTGSAALRQEFTLPEGFQEGNYMLQLTGQKGEKLLTKKLLVEGLK